MNKKILLIGLLLLSVAVLSGCDDAHVASQNLVKAADNFEIQRK